MKNLHGIVVKYLPATNYRGSRVKLTSGRFGDSVTLSYDYQFNSAVEIAQNWLETHKQKVAGTVELPNGTDVIVLEAIENRFTSLTDMDKLTTLCKLCEDTPENRKETLNRHGLCNYHGIFNQNGV